MAMPWKTEVSREEKLRITYLAETGAKNVEIAA
jgi:hypothetical protein